MNWTSGDLESLLALDFDDVVDRARSLDRRDRAAAFRDAWRLLEAGAESSRLKTLLFAQTLLAASEDRSIVPLIAQPGITAVANVVTSSSEAIETRRAALDALALLFLKAKELTVAADEEIRTAFATAVESTDVYLSDFARCAFLSGGVLSRRKIERVASAARPSQIGKSPIHLPKGVEVRQEGTTVTVKGPKGTISTPLAGGIGVKVENNVIQFTRGDDEQKSRAFHGLMRALVANNVKGVSEGFKRELVIHGVGYRAEVKGKEVVFQLGYSHPVRFPIPPGIDITVDAKTGHIVVTGIEKQRVQQTAEEIRSLREPGPYKGKGIKFSDEVIRGKSTKSRSS
jgi:ribosomal protein L6, bacterial type